MPKKTAVSASATARVERARKNMDIDLAKLARARRVLGAASDTEAVDRALDLVAFHSETFSALDRLAAAGGLTDVFGQLTEVRPAARRSRTAAR